MTFKLSNDHARWVAAAALSLPVLLAGCARGAQERSAPAGAEPAAATAASDLDRSPAQLLALTCEHAVLQYTCDECRYQVGVVKAPDELFDPARGGVLSAMELGSRGVADSRSMNGEVRLNEEKAVYLSPMAPGVVRSIRVDLGSRVSAGQTLFEVDSPDFQQAAAEHVRAAAALALALATEAREADLYERKICPLKDLQEAQAARQEAEARQRAAAGRLEGLGLSPDEVDRLAAARGRCQPGLMPVRAPFAGEVLERKLGLGALVQPGDKAFLVADTSRVWVLTDLYEREVAAVLEAQGRGPVAAEVTVAAYPGRTFPGTLERVGGTLDETTRTARARVVVENPGGLLRAGMFARVSLALGPAGGGLAVPAEAVLQDEGRSFVFVHVTGPYFMRRPVACGRTSDGWVEVAGGVKAGDRVVTKGAFLLKSDVLRSKMGAGCAD